MQARVKDTSRTNTQGELRNIPDGKIQEKSAMQGPVIFFLVVVLLVMFIVIRYFYQKQKNLQNKSRYRNNGLMTRRTIDETGNVVSETEITTLNKNLPDETIRQAARNRAFFEAIVALQKQNLDEDLFLQAIEELREKYNKGYNNQPI